MTNPAQFFVQEKALTMSVSLLFILFMTPWQVGEAYAVLGMAHYTIAYFYMYQAGKYHPVKDTLILLAFAALLIPLGLSFPLVTTILASSYLIVHVYIAELKLLKIKPDLSFTLMITALAIYLGGFYVYQYMTKRPTPLDEVSYVLLVVCVLPAMAIQYLQASSANARLLFGYILSLTLFFFVLQWVGFDLSMREVLGFIAITHFLTFYVVYFARSRNVSPDKHRQFWLLGLALNLAFLGLYLLCFYYPDFIHVRRSIFNPISFHMWTLLHFAYSWKLDDYRGCFALRINHPVRAGGIYQR